MSHSNNAAMNDLFGGMGHDHMKAEILSEGAVLLRGFAASKVERLIDALDAFTTVAPFRHMITPGGYTMSVAMTNCGEVGWVTDRSGYRYDCQDPETGDSWPSMPAVFTVLAADAADAGGYPGFAPDSCLITATHQEHGCHCTRIRTSVTSPRPSCQSRSVYLQYFCSVD